MSVSADRDHYFQTSTSIAEVERKRLKSSNTQGKPIKSSSKILGVTLDDGFDPSGNTVFVAGAAGTVSTVNLSSQEVKSIGTGSQAPITCVTTFSGRLALGNNNTQQLVFAGGWDKSVVCFTIDQANSGVVKASHQRGFAAHRDFVKCLLVARTPDQTLVLLSGGADGDVNIWNFQGNRLTSLKPQSRGIEYMALDPFSTPDAPRIFLATSQREIYSFILPSLPDMANINLSEPIQQHETSVYKLQFDNDGDLWTASADKTAKRLVRENGFVADTTLAHPDFVRDIVVNDTVSMAITACRDEEIRVWQASSSQLLHIFTGHFEEVTGLTLHSNRLVSVSIDGTIRQWDVTPKAVQAAIEEAKSPKPLRESEPEVDMGGLTEEEEAQLRALMEEEDAYTLERMVLGEQ